MDKNKKLYTTQNVLEIIDKGLKEIEVDSNTIFTPSAMDILRENGIRVLYNNCYSDSSSAINNKNVSDKNIVENLTNLLVNKYNIKDENIIKKIIVAVLKEIN